MRRVSTRTGAGSFAGSRRPAVPSAGPRSPTYVSGVGSRRRSSDSAWPPTVTPDLVMSAYRATGLRPARLIWRQGGYAHALVALLECLGGAGEGDPVERWSPPDQRVWWRGFACGWDFAADVEVQAVEAGDGRFRAGRAVGNSCLIDTGCHPKYTA